MTTAQVVEKSVTTNNTLSGGYPHPDDHGRKKKKGKKEKKRCLSNYKLHTCGMWNGNMSGRMFPFAADLTAGMSETLYNVTAKLVREGLLQQWV